MSNVVWSGPTHEPFCTTVSLERVLNGIAVTPNPDDLRLQFVDVEVERCTAWKAFEVGSTLLEAGTGPFPLGAHARVESLLVNFDAPLLGKLAGEFQRKAK